MMAISRRKVLLGAGAAVGISTARAPLAAAAAATTTGLKS